MLIKRNFVTSCMRRMTCYPLPFSITESLEKLFPHTFVVAHAVAFVIFKLRVLLTQKIVRGIKELARYRHETRTAR